jgi:hypothetical protein
MSRQNENQEIMMKPMILGIAAAGMLISAGSFAQTGTSSSGSSVPSTGSPAVMTAPRGADSAPAMTAPTGRTGQAAASGDSNQAVATTTSNAAMPAHGANSFTMAQAKSRLEKEGFSNVSNLRKDDDGVWHATADKGGSPAQAWLDYKGNVGVAR